MPPNDDVRPRFGLSAPWRRTDWWTRCWYLALAAAGGYVLAVAAGWPFLGGTWPWFALGVLTFGVAWGVRMLVVLSVESRAARVRHAEFDAKLRAMGGRR